MTELELLAHRQFRGARISRRIEWGRPADCILNVIRAAGMDAVLLSAGHAPMGTSALGPVVSEVLAEAPCPVLMEWAMTAPVNRARTQPVCCAIGSDGSEEAVLKEAVWAAEQMEAPLKIVCALEPDLSRPALLWEPSMQGARNCAAAFADRESARPLGARFRGPSGCRAAGLGVQPCHPLARRGIAGDRRFPRGTAGGGIGMPRTLCRTWQALAGRTAGGIRRREDCVMAAKSLNSDPAVETPGSAAPYVP